MILFNILLISQVSGFTWNSVSNLFNKNSNDSNSDPSPPNFFQNFQNSSFGQNLGNFFNNSRSSWNSSSPNVFQNFQNSSFGQNLGTFFNNSNPSSPNFLQNFQNSSFGQDVTNYFGNLTVNGSLVENLLTNSSFGQLVQTGIEFYNNFTNNGQNIGGNQFGFSQFVPFLANASSESMIEFNQLLPFVLNSTIEEFEQKVNNWAVKYGYDSKVDEFNKKSANLTSETEANAYRTIANLELVMNNLKSIYGNKNQTFIEMHQTITNYISNLDLQTQEIIFILFKPLLPPQLKNFGCTLFGESDNSFLQKTVNIVNGLVNSNENEKSNFNIPLIVNFLEKNNATGVDLSSLSNGFQGFIEANNGQISIGNEAVPLGDVPAKEEIVKPKNGKKNNKNKKNKKTTPEPEAEVL